MSFESGNYQKGNNIAKVQAPKSVKAGMFVFALKISPLLGFLFLLASPVRGFSQAFQLCFQPVFTHDKIVLDKPIYLDDNDSLIISTLKCYVGNFQFWKNGKPVFAEKTYHLLDLEDETTLCLSVDLPGDIDLDSIVFGIGVDSLTTASGVLGGDLDPTKGMFWAWQSGYINLKLEGTSSKCPTRKGRFEFHLGGYLPPFRTDRQVGVRKVVQNPSDVINLDLAPFFRAVNWEKKSSIMSPCAEAVQLTTILATSFLWHEK